MLQELEIQVLSDRREGLLIELGKIVIAHGYALLRQRMTHGSQGVQLTLFVRGDADQQLILEDALNSHPRVLGIEVGTPEHSPHTASAPVSSNAPPPSPSPRVPATGPSLVIDMSRVEAVLPHIAGEFPRIFPRLLNLKRELAPEACDNTLKQVGRRTGAWVYKREFALGGRLPLAEAVKRIALPALRNLVNAELHDEGLRVPNSPMCLSGNEHGPSCHFLCGYLEGVLSEAESASAVAVHEIYCRTTGSDACVFRVAG